MPANPSQLTILAPGLLGPQPDLARLAAGEQPDASQLRTLLSRADWQRQERTGRITRLMQLFGFEPAVCEQPPLAAITAEQDGIDTRGRAVMRADPVHLQIDIDRALMSQGDDLQLAEAEADALLADLDAHFAEDGLRFVKGTARRWYLLLDTPAGIHSTDIEQVRGHNIFDYLPEGDAYRRWRTFLNEVQMLLHSHAVNQHREATGQASANSVWLWGEGELPSTPARKHWDRVYSDDELVQAIAGFCGIDCSPLAAFSAAAVDGRQLLVIQDFAQPSRSRDVFAWSDRIEEYDRALFGPLEKALRNRNDLSLHIDARDGRIARIDKHRLRRFWRRRKPLDKLLDNPLKAP